MGLDGAQVEMRLGPQTSGAPFKAYTEFQDSYGRELDHARGLYAMQVARPGASPVCHLLGSCFE